MDRIAVLIPCFNEGKTIEKVICDFRSVLPDAVIYVYDNNSTDDTAIKAEKSGAIVRYERVQGKGNVIRRMLREIDAECYLLVNGDDTYPADTAKTMGEEVLLHQADMVIGDRLSSTYYQENKRPFHNAGNAFVKRSINSLFNVDTSDILTGYRALSYEFVKTFPVLLRGFEIETEMSIHAADKNMKIVNMAVDYRDRPEGSVSKLDTFSDGRKVIGTILRLFRTYRPMRYFGLLAFVLIALGVMFMIPVFYEYFITGYVRRFPTLIVCGFSIVAGIMSLFTGIILNTATWKNRQDFEMQLIRAHDREMELVTLDNRAVS